MRTGRLSLRNSKLNWEVEILVTVDYFKLEFWITIDLTELNELSTTGYKKRLELEVGQGCKNKSKLDEEEHHTDLFSALR